MNRSFRISAEYCGIFLNLFIQFFRCFRQFPGGESLALQIFQRVQQGIADFESGGIHCILAGALVVDDCDLFFRIRFAFQVDRFTDHGGKAVKAIRYCTELHQAAFVREQGGKNERDRSAVEFRHDYALTQHTAGHAALIPEVFVIRLADLDRAEQRDIETLQRFQSFVRGIDGESSVRLIDDQFRFDYIQQTDPVHHSGNADNVQLFGFQSLNQRFQIAASVSGEYADRRIRRVVFAEPFVEVHILFVGREYGFLVFFRMEECGARNFFRRQDFCGEQEFPVDGAAGVIHQTPEIRFAAGSHIGLNLFGLLRGKGVQFGFCTGGGCDIERLFLADQFIDCGFLGVVELKSHAEEIEDIVLPEDGGIGFVIPFDRFDMQEFSEVLIQLGRQHVIRVIDHADACRRHAVPAEYSQSGKHGEEQGSDPCFFLFHFASSPSGT